MEYLFHTQASARIPHEPTRTEPISSRQCSPSICAHFSPSTQGIQVRPFPHCRWTRSSTHPPPPTVALLVKTCPSPQSLPPTNSTIAHVTLPSMSPRATLYRSFSCQHLVDARGRLQYGCSGRPLDRARPGESVTEPGQSKARIT
jgi:hypothetical protein